MLQLRTLRLVWPTEPHYRLTVVFLLDRFHAAGVVFMPAMVTSWTAVVVTVFLCLCASFATSADIHGKVGYSVDGINVVALKQGSVTELLLSSNSGEQIRTFADRDGRFTLHDVAPGTYALTTQNSGFIYPEVSWAVHGFTAGCSQLAGARCFVHRVAGQLW